MSDSLPKQVMGLPQEQQDAIVGVLQKAKLLNSSGQPQQLGAADLPEDLKRALGGAENQDNIFDDFNPGCIAARIAEAAAVVACASVPGGQIAVVACVAAAHALADKAC